MELRGILVPVLTPFRGDGEVDEEALRGLVDYLLGAGVSGIVPCGSTGEAPYLSREERRRVVEWVVDQVDGRVPVVAGTGALGTKETITLTRDALEAGADAALVVTPFYFGLSEEEVFGHYAALLDAVDLPILVYNVPKFTGYSLPPKVLERLVSEYDGVVGVKDSSGNPGLMAEILRLVGNRISVLSGSADLILQTLMLGGHGAIVAVGNADPEACVALYRAFREGRMEEAARHQMRVSFLNRVLVREHNQIAALKEALRLRGRPAGVPRRPIMPLSEGERREVEEALRSVSLI
ncbi:4-hydroxy-tetrahydrodipicolinate synthase [Candidatus Bathyarchaeota archaeon]|nr:MAG: 4-hydroxy-tetrahydrodipicolinate synthase [Candidatus Bathyarchaeota archaeon]